MSLEPWRDTAHDYKNAPRDVITLTVELERELRITEPALIMPINTPNVRTIRARTFKPIEGRIDDIFCIVISFQSFRGQNHERRRDGEITDFSFHRDTGKREG